MHFDTTHTARHSEPRTYLPVHVPRTPKKPSRLAALRTWWTTAWAEGGFLHRRWDDVFAARHAGWHGMANWIKVTLGLFALGWGPLLLDAVPDVANTVLHGLFTALGDGPPTGTDSGGLRGVIDNPVRSYIGQNSAGLAVPASALYAFWQLAGLLGLIGGCAGNTGARITWVLWGAASAAMVWAASPAGGRTVATGLAALMWALASILALRGLSLRPVINNHPPEFRPGLHIYATIQAAPDAADFDDEPDNIHQFRQR
ncbi:hypothetical protein [Streptomyces geranii]|uniref:hypothetical protein n=1 Tax=Streptomyces geranii TaxID=2058923 RepID=UPI000D02D4B7|nr:hypothetical protein [Streptomyces geranii]